MMDFKILAALLREMAGNCYLKFIQLMVINQILTTDMRRESQAMKSV